MESTPPGLTFEMVVTTSGSIFGLRPAHCQPAVRSFHERTTDPNPGISSPYAPTIPYAIHLAQSFDVSISSGVALGCSSSYLFSKEISVGRNFC